MKNIRFMNPFLPLDNLERLKERLIQELGPAFNIPDSEINLAAQKAWDELESARQDMRDKGEETLAYIREHHMKGIVLGADALIISTARLITAFRS